MKWNWCLKIGGTVTQTTNRTTGTGTVNMLSLVYENVSKQQKLSKPHTDKEAKSP